MAFSLTALVWIIFNKLFFMGKEKFKRKDFLKNFAGLAGGVTETVTDEPPPGGPDPLFKKYSRKKRGNRLYSTVMAVPGSNGELPENVRVGNITSGLAPYTGTWDVWQVTHLLRRVGFGVKKTDLDALLALTPSAAVDQLMVLSPPANPSPSNL